MPTPREAAILKAQKLAALSADQPDTPEGRVAGELLARLKGKWSLKDDELVAVEIQRALLDRGTEDEWRIFLLAICAEFFGCSSTHAKQHSVLYGTPKEIEYSRGLYERLAKHVDQSLLENEDIIHLLYHKHSWAMTMVMVFNARLQNLRQQEEAQAAGQDQTGLVRQRTAESSAKEARTAAKGGEIRPQRWTPIPEAIEDANRVTLREPDAPPPDQSPDAVASAPG